MVTKCLNKRVRSLPLRPWCRLAIRLFRPNGGLRFKPRKKLTVTLIALYNKAKDDPVAYENCIFGESRQDLEGRMSREIFLENRITQRAVPRSLRYWSLVEGWFLSQHRCLHAPAS